MRCELLNCTNEANGKYRFKVGGTPKFRVTVEACKEHADNLAAAHVEALEVQVFVPAETETPGDWEPYKGTR